MEVKSVVKKLPAFLQKYKYVALIILIGIVLMLLPTGTQTKTEEISAQTNTVQEEINIEKELERMLEQTAGVGNVKVLLTKGEGEETIYQTDTESANNDTERTKRSNTVTVTDSERSQTGLVRQVNPPTYLGAVVVCQGGDDPQVRLKVIDAVSKATGLGANCISVLRMK